MAGRRVMGHNMLTRHHPQWPFHIWSVPASPPTISGWGKQSKRTLYQTQPWTGGGELAVFKTTEAMSQIAVSINSHHGGVLYCCKLSFSMKKFSPKFRININEPARDPVIYKYLYQTWIHSFLILIWQRNILTFRLNSGIQGLYYKQKLLHSPILFQFPDSFEIEQFF